MKELADKTDSPNQKESSAKVPAPEVERALSAILQSAPFRSSLQIQKLLQFLVSESLAGRAELLKERIVGASVFDRRPDYDTNVDPIVRLRVAEVRKRLALYYQAAREETVLISIPSGSFKAVFERTKEAAAPPPSAIPRALEQITQPYESVVLPAQKNVAAAELTQSPARFLNRTWWIAIACLVAVSILATLRLMPSPESRALNQFWSPVLKDSNTILIHIGNNAVYELSSTYRDKYFQKFPITSDEQLGFENYLSMPPGSTVAAEDLHPARDVYHTNGDVTAIIAVTSLFVRRNRPFDIRYGSDMTFGDIRESPTVLIGAHNNFWTMTMTANFRYRFEGHNAIVDHADPKVKWIADSDRTEDYAILTRVLSSSSGPAFIAIAGVGDGGTRAASEFVTNPQSVLKIVKTLPKSWESKNIQIVLHTTVRNQIPGPPEVVATYTW